MSTYPPLRIPVLQGLIAIRQQLDADPDFLNKDECPYDGDLKKVLVDLCAVREKEVVVEREVPVTGQRGRPSKDIKLDADDQKKILTEIKSTIDSLNTMQMNANLQTGELIQIAKTKTGLLDQLLKMMERHTTVAKTEEFKENVIGILNDLVSEADREIFQQRMGAFR